MYVCTAVLQFPGEQDDVMTSSSTNVTVQGKAVHTHDVSIELTNQAWLRTH